MNLEQYEKSKYKDRVKTFVLECDAIRTDKHEPTDISFGEYLQKQEEGLTIDALMEDMGIEPQVDTLKNIQTLPSLDARYIIPEIYREAIRLGLRKSPIYPSIIALEQSWPNLTVNAPHWNMSDATPEFLGEAETIPVGTMSHGTKSFKLKKMGKGITVPYEVSQYVPLSIVSIFLQDFGIKLGMGQDVLLIDVLINGEQADGSESAAVVGVASASTLAYKDLLKVWVRGSRMGRMYDNMISGETMAIDILDLAEFKTRNTGTPDKKLNLKTPVPNQVNHFIHGNVPANQVIGIDSGATVIKYNSAPLLVETERIVSNQTQSTYATLTTGFGIIYRDGRIIIDRSVTIGASPFPSWFDVDAAEDVVIE